MKTVSGVLRKWVGSGVFLFLVGCSGAVTLPDDTVVIGVSSDPGGLFPPTVSNNTAFSLVNQIFLRLADIGPDLNSRDIRSFEPQLASTWEFEDSLTLVFHLNPEARWHDGAPVTATDILFTFDVYRDPEVVGSAPHLSAIEAVQARDPVTVVLTFNRHYPEQFFDATYHTYILPEHLLGEVERRNISSWPFARAPIGAGRYRVVEWVPDTFIELESVEEHFLGEARIHRQIWRAIPDRSSRLELLLAGELDLLKTISPINAIRSIQESDRANPVVYDAGAYGYLTFNFRDPGNPAAPHPLFSDLNTRRGIAMAIDRAVAVRAVFSEWGVVPPGPVSPMQLTWGRDIEQLPLDTASAAEYLAAGGWTDTDGDGIRDRRGAALRFELIYPATSNVRGRFAVILQSQLRAVGVDVRILPLAGAALAEAFTTGAFDAALGYWNQDPTPSVVLQTWTTAGIGGSNFSSYSNLEFDSLVGAAANEFDETRAIQLWKEAYGVINRDAGAVWLYSPLQVSGVSERMENVELRSDIWVANLYRAGIREQRQSSGND